MIIGSLAGPLCAGGGFCAGNNDIVEHQRINSAAYTYSAALPAILSTTASETITLLQENPEVYITPLRENAKAMRAQLDPRSDWVKCTSAVENPNLLLVIKKEVVDARTLSVQDQEMLMQDVVDEVSIYVRHLVRYSADSDLQAIASGVMITRMKAMPAALGVATKDIGWQPQPALKVCVTVGLSKKDTEKAGVIIRHAITKIMTRKK